MVEQLSFRTDLSLADRSPIDRLVRATGVFSESEALVAVELVDETLARGEASGYLFLIAELHDQMVGYACHGLIPATEGSFDLYWIVVDPQLQGRGIGAELLTRVEADVRQAGGQRLWVDTSERADYAPTRRFYERCGYSQAASLSDFYAPGDGKAIFVKRFADEG